MRLNTNSALGVASEVAARGHKKLDTQDVTDLRRAFAQAENPGAFLHALVNSPLFENSLGLDMALTALNGGGESGAKLPLQGFMELAEQLTAWKGEGRKISAADVNALGNFLTLMAPADAERGRRFLTDSPLLETSRQSFAQLTGGDDPAAAQAATSHAYRGRKDPITGK